MTSSDSHKPEQPTKPNPPEQRLTEVPEKVQSADEHNKEVEHRPPYGSPDEHENATG